MDERARRIVASAREHAQRYPARSALEVLDMAMAGHQGSAPDFSTGDAVYRTALHPATEFGALVCEAFALGLPPHAPDRQWRREIVDAFVRRYRLGERESALV